MKNKINQTILILLLVITKNSYSQDCIKLYIDKHLSGSPICKLRHGDYIEICEESNKINGCQGDFYIYDKGWKNGSLSYELSLDKGWSTHYMTMMVNTNTKKLGFEIQGQIGIYSYVTEAEMRVINEENEKKRLAESEEKKLNDQVLITKINRLLEENNSVVAASYYSDLNFFNDKLYMDINKSLEKKVIDEKIVLKLDSTKLIQLIKENINYFDTLSNGKKSIFINKNGNVYINENETDFVFKESFIYFGKQNNFKIKVPGKYEFNFKTEIIPTEIITSECKVFQIGLDVRKFCGLNLAYIVQDKNGEELVLGASRYLGVGTQKTPEITEDDIKKIGLFNSKYPTIIKKIEKLTTISEESENYSILKEEKAKIIYCKLLILNNKEIIRIEKNHKIMKFKSFRINGFGKLTTF